MVSFSLAMFFKKNKKIRAHIFVSGRVQGVFFRQQTKEKADKMGVSGWIRNLDDGRVEAMFEGGEKEVNEMVGWTRQGPVWAKVDDFSVILEDCKKEPGQGFKVR